MPTATMTRPRKTQRARPSPAPAGGPSRPEIDAAEWIPLVCKKAIQAGAHRRDVMNSEQFGDGMLGLARAICSYNPRRTCMPFPAFAGMMIRYEILDGLYRGRGKRGSARRAAMRAIVTAQFSQLDHPSDRGSLAQVLAVVPEEGDDGRPIPAPLAEALRGLKPRLREAFLAYALEGKGYAEVAAGMEPPLCRRSAMTYVQRARKALARALGGIPDRVATRPPTYIAAAPAA